MKQEQLSKGTVIDVREPFEFFFGHVKGSINIPLGSVTAKLDELKQMQKPLIFICASGNRSGQAVAFLKNQGWKDVHNGGGWREFQQREAA
ncbi:MAG: rhodanese-like domain-containing protein [Saprospiraceae bacterium]|nr:rhodanese-like domain-containing protein [Saprospiraceae bacterium]